MFEQIVLAVLGFFAQFPTQIFAAYMLFVIYFDRRPYFWVRIVACGAFYLSLPYWFGYSLVSIGWLNLTFFIEFLLCGLIMFACFRITWRQALFFSTAAYGIQHCLDNGVWLFIEITRMDGGSLLSKFLGLLVRAAELALFWFLFARRIKGNISDENGRFAVNDVSIIILSVITVLIVYVLSMYASYTSGSSGVRYIYSISCCMLLLFLQFGLFDRGKKEEDAERLRHMLELEHEQHRLSKENIEMINMKCHDLKHQISDLRKMTDSDRLGERLREMEKHVMIYDSFIKTGNSALDIVLTEKNLFCERYDIRIQGSIDGTAAAFLSEEDIYSLFGNILDNAIEAVKAIDKEKRLVTLSVAAQKGFLIIHSDNYCEVAPAFRDGLPQTTKGDSVYHGFGFKSIRYIAGKYGGSANAKVNGKSFVLNVLIPLPDGARGDAPAHR